jgi:hypothetical protein
MADPVSRSWWHTFPGVLTAVAGILTALGTLVLALHQAGVLGAAKPPAAHGVADATARDTTPDSGASPSLPPQQPPAAALPPNVVRLGELEYTLLAAKAEPLSSQKWALRFEFRLNNGGRFPASLGDANFRLRIDDIPRVPVSGLGKIVDGRSAEEGEVRFEIPYSAKTLQLVIFNGDDSGTLHVAFAAPAVPVAGGGAMPPPMRPDFVRNLVVTDTALLRHIKKLDVAR